MNIGEAAARVGLPTKTIRYYETIGLLPAPLRSDGNYRVYGERELRVLQFIHRARALGFSLKEVADLLALWHDQRRASAEVRGLAQRHIAEIDRKLEELRAIRATLDDLVHRCHGDDRPDCPILDDLAGSAAPRRPRKGRAHG
jgi:Cu(I)-responsive transcriptional regulator